MTRHAAVAAVIIAGAAAIAVPARGSAAPAPAPAPAAPSTPGAPSAPTPPAAPATPAAPSAPGTRSPSFAEKLATDLRELVDAAIVARPPKLVPPQKLPRAWKLAKLGSVELGAPLVTLAGGDLDGDGRGELYAVTASEVIAIGMGRDKKLRELGRVAFTGDRSAIAPRDVVGSAIVDGTTLLASVSTFARGVRVSWQAGTMVVAPGMAGFMLCPGELAQLVPGRNTFAAAAAGNYGARCTSRLVDGDGYPLRARAQLSLTSKLDVSVERCAASNLGCQMAARHEYASAGTAFEIADVDRDGVPEAIFAGAAAPGDPDTLKVISLGDDDKKPRLKKAFAAGGVAGIATLDLDGDGAPETIAAVRIVSSPRADLWRIE